MKTLKVKSILFSLMALIVVSLFISSCTQEDLTINQDTQLIDVQKLAEGISQSDNYMSVQEVRGMIFEDLLNFYESNQEAIEENSAIFENYLSTNTKFEEELRSHTTALKNEFPALNTITEEQIAEVFEIVNNMNVVAERSCWQQCNDLYLRCDSICYDRYLWFSSFTYNDYLFCNGICVENVFYSCIDDC